MRSKPFSNHPLTPPLPTYQPRPTTSWSSDDDDDVRPRFTSAITVTTCIASTSAPRPPPVTKLSKLFPIPSPPSTPVRVSPKRPPTWRTLVFSIYTIPILNSLLQLAVIVGTATYLPSFNPSSSSSSTSPPATGPVRNALGVAKTPDGIAFVNRTISVSLFSVWWVALTGIWAMQLWWWPVREAFAGAGRQRRGGPEGEAVRRERAWGLVWGSFLPWVEAAGVVGVGMVFWGY